MKNPYPVCGYGKMKKGQILGPNILQGLFTSMASYTINLPKQGWKWLLRHCPVRYEHSSTPFHSV